MYPISKERLEEYLNGTVLRTANFSGAYRDNITLGLYGEAGEVCDDIKKYWFHNSLTWEQARNRLVKEAGDWLFYYTWQQYATALIVQERYETAKPVWSLMLEEFWVPDGKANQSDAWAASMFAKYAETRTGLMYLTILLENWEISIEEVLATNEAKLAERHPNGWQGGKKEN